MDSFLRSCVVLHGIVLSFCCACAEVPFGPGPAWAVWMGHVAAAYRLAQPHVSLRQPNYGCRMVVLWFPAPIGSCCPWSSSCKREARIPAHRWKRLPPIASVGSLPAGTARGARARRCHSGGEAPRLLRCCSRLRGPSPLRHRRKASLAAELAVQGRCDVGARRARRLVILLVRCPIRRRWPSNQWRLSS